MSCYLVIAADNIQCDTPLEAPIYVCPLNSALSYSFVNLPDKQVADKTAILNNLYGINQRGVVWTWDQHPEVEKRTLSFFDYGWTIKLEKESQWTPRSYFNLLSPSDNIEPGKDILNTGNVGTGYTVDNSIKNNIVHGGNVALIVMKLNARTRRAERERHRVLLRATLALECNSAAYNPQDN